MGVSHAVLVLGLAITAIVALLQQSNVKTTRQLTFDAAAAKVQEELVDEVNTQVENFESDLNFLRATHPGPLDQFRAYFSQRSSEAAVVGLYEGDPGFILIETVPNDEIDALTERERSIGNTSFAPLLLTPSQDDRRIVTRTTYEMDLLGLPILGLDLSALQDNVLLNSVINREGLGMMVIRSDEIVDLLAGDPTVDERTPEFAAFLSATVFGHEGQLIGNAFESQPIDLLLGSIDGSELEGLSVQLYVEGIPESIDQRLSPNAQPMEAATLRASREATTATLNWRIEVWADNDYGPPTGLFEQAWVWMIGVLSTAALYVASVRRQQNRLQFDRAQFELAHAQTLARTDALTGLLNRNGLVDAARGMSSKGAATVFFIDLDGFKEVNDTGGHELGDQVLRSVAIHLRSIFRTEDLVSRLGGDEFLVFTEQPGTEDYVNAICIRITKAVSEIDERVSCSLGVASRPANSGTDIKELARAADVAMYEAKRSGGDRYIVSDAVEASSKV